MKKYPCACCGYLTMYEPLAEGTYDICPICFWEDDSYQFEYPNSAGGANHISLVQAKANFQIFGASEERWKKHVRPPKPEEIPPEKREDKRL